MIMSWLKPLPERSSLTPRLSAGLMKYCALVGASVLMLVFTSCKKIQERKIINGTWKVVKVELDHGDANAMEVFLNGYRSNSECCSYIVDFRDDHSCSGTYYRDDSLIYTVEGEWKLKEFNLVYVKLDQYVNADLDVDRHSRTYYTLETEKNTVAVLNQVLPAKLEIKRID